MIYSYSTLVSHESVRKWDRVAISATGFMTDLYTQVTDSGETDEFERWFCREFEDPAEGAIERATSGRPLAREHWRRLVRFMVAQDCRTLKNLSEKLPRWREEIPLLIGETLERIPDELKAAKQSSQRSQRETIGSARLFPLRVRTGPSDDPAMATLELKTVVGRQMWLWHIEHTRTNTLRKLPRHKWTILKAPEGIGWFTTDDPVVKLKHLTNRGYNFDGGWGLDGTEIFMPLDPKHLLYTVIGGRPPLRDTELSTSSAQEIRRLIAQHAFRNIYYSSPDAGVPRLHPRKVDMEIFRSEREQLKNWHQDQSAAERELRM
jgi:hypothetical protein